MSSAGAMRWRVELQTVTTTNEGGFPVETSSHLADVAAERGGDDGSEHFAGSQFTAPNTTTWTIWWRPDMDPEALDVPKLRRLMYQGRVYNITAARTVGWRKEIALQTLSGGLET